MSNLDYSLIWKAYRAGLRDPNPKSAAKMLRMNEKQFMEYLENWGVFKEAFEAGVADRDPLPVNILDPETKQIWDDLCAMEDVDERQKALMLLADGGDHVRQKLLAQALMDVNFNLHRAMKLVGVTPKEYRKWLGNPQFSALMAGIHDGKKIFVESALMDLVAQGEVKAVLAANESLNKEVYGKTIEVNQNHQIGGKLDLLKMGLPLRLRCELLEFLSQSGYTDMDGMLASDSDIVDAPSVRQIGQDT